MEKIISNLEKRILEIKVLLSQMDEVSKEKVSPIEKAYFYWALDQLANGKSPTTSGFINFVREKSL